jgi:predicted SAM-dependent methyltransferase
MKCLNLGCGARFHPDWVNLDIAPAAPEVKKWDLQGDLPFADVSFDVIYHSHVLEHFSRSDGQKLLQRCHRVLSRGGTLRVVVPDLERIARIYLQALDGCLAGDEVWKNRYDWILLEMYDQAVRDVSGGEMLAYVRREPIPERDFVIERIGREFHAMTAMRRHSQHDRTVGERFAEAAVWMRGKLKRLVVGRKGMRAQAIGAFRESGEVHRNMYDRYSLTRALLEAGFSLPRIVGPAESAIEGWAGLHLDTEPDGRVYKPDSLYMEAERA